MYRFNFYCKNCQGILYEDEIFSEEDGVKYMQVSCFRCPKQIFVNLSKWNAFKRKIEKCLARNKYERKTKTSSGKVVFAS